MESEDRLIKLKEIEEEILKLKELEKREKLSLKDALDVLNEKRNSFFENLQCWDRVMLARHAQRPHCIDYIKNIVDDFIEFSGDRYFSDDKAMICGFGKIGGISVCISGLEKGRDLNEKVVRNFGMAHPEGYRKSARIFKLAEKFGVPVITFIDTPGAYPGIEAEERGQSIAIAENIKLLFKLNVPVIACIIGEGGSGGALAIGVADIVLMLENSIYSVISPEGCASILWRDAKYAKNAAENLKLTSYDLKKMGIIDEIIKEPQGGIHENPKIVYNELRNHIVSNLKSLKTVKEIRKTRINRYRNIGIFNE
ncbi:MAG: acetyl-CoA carboxylase carboxyltransferase subunit alpha [Candidatus Muirbacterium halophilum]|nr:acetyl-CoA carboxylase carboxyltransferase subunit alpha [Candidatus Muirbacterium halophilum]MCK9476946.1 acetyl-CoA carboxylase carboxyltransferase subunit alpha [Candidatus Muirbacterium halophilum]